MSSLRLHRAYALRSIAIEGIKSSAKLRSTVLVHFQISAHTTYKNSGRSTATKSNQYHDIIKLGRYTSKIFDENTSLEKLRNQYIGAKRPFQLPHKLQ